MKRISALKILFCLPAFILACQPSFAMDISYSGSTVQMSGPVVKGDCDRLKAIISANKIERLILTDSLGGDANTGFCVGETIRANNISTVIKGYCESSCSRMWLGGVTRKLDGDDSTVGLHGNYDFRGHLIDESTVRLREWIPRFAPKVDVELMNRWTSLYYNHYMMFFYNDRAQLCLNGSKECENIAGRNVFNAGLESQ
ncbi:hypothetical protein [Polynucleobacter sp. IMCC30063]|uniref:hypothetical protein n=1 Tax=Polynucleobacter sp. IMCC30063 TaxID=2907298 RepID=UPI001F24230F|nr:hypothetical protein [Polynucleobacter sp. IMCC30063]